MKAKICSLTIIASKCKFLRAERLSAAQVAVQRGGKNEHQRSKSYRSFANKSSTLR